MSIEDKYNKLRAAALQMIGVEDDKTTLLAMLGELHSSAPDGDEDAAAAMALLVALIETH